MQVPRRLAAAHADLSSTSRETRPEQQRGVGFALCSLLFVWISAFLAGELPAQDKTAQESTAQESTARGAATRASESVEVDAETEAGRANGAVTAVEAAAIAREGFIYGFPIVETYRRMHASAIDSESAEYCGPFNTITHDTELAAPDETDVETPDLDTLASFLWMDLRAEPVRIHIPAIEDDRYYAVQFVDLYHFNFAYLGSRTTGNGEGDYLIVGPSWTGETPAGIEKHIRSETDFALAIFRTQLKGPKDLERVKAIQDEYAVQPLSQFLGRPPPAVAPSITFPEPVSPADSGLAFFSALDFILQFCPPHPTEREIREKLKRIGVAADGDIKPAELSLELQEAIRRGVEEGKAAIASAASTLKVREVAGARDSLNTDYLKRAAGAKLGDYNPSKEEAIYQLYLTDADGNPLDASENNYVLRMSEAELPPVHGFWSITMYDGQSKGVVQNALQRYRITSQTLPELVRDAEGGLAILLQNEPPVEEQTANWLPAPDGPFYIVMRLYGPKPEVLEGPWTPPLVWPAEETPETAVPTPEGAEAAEEVMPTVIAVEPKPEMERPAVWEEPTEVEVAIYVIDVDEVNSASQNFSASIYFEAHWKNPFLRHKGPHPTHQELTEVWNPRLTVISQQMAWRSYPESVEIRPDGTVIYRQKMWGRFSQR